MGLERVNQTAGEKADSSGSEDQFCVCSWPIEPLSCVEITPLLPEQWVIVRSQETRTQILDPFVTPTEETKRLICAPDFAKS